MQRKKEYKLYIRVMILSGIILAVTLTFTSLKIIRDGKKFTQVMLEENRAFLINTLRLGYGLMSHTGNQNSEVLINLAMESKFIKYLALLDARGKIIAQSDLTCPLPTLKALDLMQLKDGKILEETDNILLISYRAGEIVTDETPWKHHAAIERPDRGSNRISWFLFALDLTAFKKHHYDMVSHTLVSAAAFLLFGTLIIIFFGITQRYELANLSINKLNKTSRLLGHFVPEAVKNMIEEDPERTGLLNKNIQDATILFLDIEGFTLLQAKYSQERINRAVESYFSSFFDLIRKNGGDINETAGDGMMVIFLHDDAGQHAQNAVRTALAIQEQCRHMSTQIGDDLFPIRVNIGIGSGKVYLGSTKMSGTEAERWTFTASGGVTNLAARLEQYAQGGQILIGEETARRVEGLFPMKRLGEISLKNMKNSGEIFEVSLPQSAPANAAKDSNFQQVFKPGNLEKN
jgi:class 3 adenylate cyclase